MKWHYRLIISIVLFSLAITIFVLTASNDDYSVALLGAMVSGLMALAGFVVLLHLSPKDIEERARIRNERGPLRFV